MRTRNLIEKALELVLQGRSAKDARKKDEVFDGLWELLVNLEYELRQRQASSSN
jgi:hypothetical protein